MCSSMLEILSFHLHCHLKYVYIYRERERGVHVVSNPLSFGLRVLLGDLQNYFKRSPKDISLQ